MNQTPASVSGAGQARPWTRIADLSQLDAVFETARQFPALLLLHDPWCPISAYAWEQVTEAAVAAPVWWLDVSNGRELSRAVEMRTGVRHQSPQAFVVAGGIVAWSASHGRITADAVTVALADAAEVSVRLLQTPE